MQKNHRHMSMDISMQWQRYKIDTDVIVDDDGIRNK